MEIAYLCVNYLFGDIRENCGLSWYLSGKEFGDKMVMQINTNHLKSHNLSLN